MHAHIYTHTHMYTCVYTHIHSAWYDYVISFSFLDLNFFSRFSAVYYFYNRKMLNTKKKKKTG